MGVERAPYGVTMWDFSWVTRRSGDEAEYHDWDRVLDELVDRGYRCVRIEALPHLIGAGGPVRERASILPQADEFLWGNHSVVEIAPAADLVDFVGRLAERDLRVGLSTWLIADTTGRADSVRHPDDYVRAWTETLALLDGEGLLGVVEWVDLQNEFPLPHYTPGYTHIFGVERSDRTPMQRAWTEEEYERAQAYLDAVDALRARWPDLRYTVSYTSILQVLELDASGFDLAEAHVWLGPTPPFSDRTGHNAAMNNKTPDAVRRHVTLVDEVYWADRDTWHATLRGFMDLWHGWAEARDLPLVNTEGWASIHYETYPTPSGRDPWDYVRDVAEVAVDHALARGWEGICTSNFSQPHFEEFWADAAWHRRVNERIDEWAPAGDASPDEG